MDAEGLRRNALNEEINELVPLRPRRVHAVPGGQDTRPPIVIFAATLARQRVAQLL